MKGRRVNALRARGGGLRTLCGASGTQRRAAPALALALALLTTGGIDYKTAQLNNRANEELEAAKIDEAAQLYEEAQTRAPDSPEIAYNRGNVLYRQGRLVDAIEQLTHGTQSMDPDVRRKCYSNLGRALHDYGKLEDAAVSYRRALALDPQDLDAKVAYEKTMEEIRKRPKQPQSNQSKGDKNKQQQQKGQQQQSGQQSGDQQGDQTQQGQQSQSGDQNDQQGEQQQAESGDESQDQEGEDEERQAAAIDSLAAGDLSREEAVRILEAMREQERELQRERARKRVRPRRVEKDW